MAIPQLNSHILYNKSNPGTNFLGKKQSHIAGSSVVNDVFIKKSNLAFLGTPPETERLKKAKQYIKNVNNYYGNNHKVDSLYYFDPKLLEGILDGIEVFKGLTVYDLYLMNDMHWLLFQRGCPESKCSHCMVNAKTKVETMPWENITKLADGMGELTNRLGFNPFNHKEQRFMPYFDSDPLLLQSYDIHGGVHNIAEVQERFYDKTKTPFTIITAGWDPQSFIHQTAANDLVDLFKRKPESFSNLNISLHAFHNLMTKSIKAETPEDKQKYRKEYIDRMTNVIITFLPIFQAKKAAFSFEYVDGVPENSPYSYESTSKLANEIMDNVEKVCSKQGKAKEDYAFLTENRTFYPNDYFSVFCISSAGRAKKLLHDNSDPFAYKFKKTPDGPELLIGDINAKNGNNLYLTKIILKNSHFIKKVFVNVDLNKEMPLEEYNHYIYNIAQNCDNFFDLFDRGKANLNIISNDESKTRTFLSYLEYMLKHNSKYKKKSKLYTILDRVVYNKIDPSEFKDSVKSPLTLYDAVPDNEQYKPIFLQNIIYELPKMVNANGKVFIADGWYDGFINNKHLDDSVFLIKDLGLHFSNGVQMKDSKSYKTINVNKSQIIADENIITRDILHDLIPKDDNIKPVKPKEENIISFGKRLMAFG